MLIIHLSKDRIWAYTFFVISGEKILPRGSINLMSETDNSGGDT